MVTLSVLIFLWLIYSIFDIFRNEPKKLGYSFKEMIDLTNLTKLPAFTYFGCIVGFGG
jgi:hypothetical protein